MADATVTTSITNVPAVVATRLRSLRLRVAIWFLVEGFAWLLLSLPALALADLAIDWLVRLGWESRCFLLVLNAGGLLAIVFWRVIRPLCYSLSDDALCLQVEHQHRQLGQSLISAVQFSKMRQPPAGVSETFVHATIDSGSAAAGQVDFAEALNARRFYANMALLIGGLLLTALGAVVAASTVSGQIWFQRNVLLSGTAMWPQDTYLEIQGLKDGRFVMPRGESRLLEVAVTDDSRRIPKDLVVDFRGSQRRPPQRMQHVASSKRRFKLELKNVYEKFEFRVRVANTVMPWFSHVKTEWIQVELVDQPAVADLRLEVTPPSYTGDGPQRLPPGKGPYHVLAGSSLKILGRSTKPLAAVELKIRGDEPVSLPVKIFETSRFSASLKPEQLIGGTYDIILKDTEEIASKRPTSFAIQIRPDREPQVRAELHGISGMVVPQATIPFSCRTSDDYAVTDVRLFFEWHSNEDPKLTAKDTVKFAQVAEKVPATEVELEDNFQLQSLSIPTGSTLEFKFQAEDNDNISGPKVGESSGFLVRVVTEEELRIDLLRREKEQRQTLEHLLKTQEDLLTDTAALAADVAGKTPLSAKQKQQLMKFQRQQKLIGTNAATISQRLKSLLLEVSNNKLEKEDGPLKKRLNKNVILPLDQLVVEDVPEAVQTLDEARRQAENTIDRDASLKQSAAQQQVLADKIRDILLHLIKAEGYQEAINLLYQVEKSQKKVYDLVEKEKQDQTRRILEQDGKSKTPKKEEKNDK